MSDQIERIVAAGRSYGISCSLLGEDHCCSKATEEYLRTAIEELLEARVAASREEETAVTLTNGSPVWFRPPAINEDAPITNERVSYGRPEPLREETGEPGLSEWIVAREAAEARAERNRVALMDAERRLTGVENLAATAMRERDAAIERAERAEAERDRMLTALEGSAMKVAFWRWDDDRMVERGWKKHAMFAMHVAQDDEPYHGFADGWNAAVRAVAESRQSTPVSSEED